MSYLVILLLLLAGFITGATTLLAYILVRMMRNKGWDASNITNALRLLSHVTLHPQDFGQMRYVDSSGNIYGRPFWYVNKDELSEVVKTRP